MESILNKLSSSFQTKKINELEIDQKYKCSNFKIIKTKYGNQITVMLDNDYYVFLPNRFTKILKQEDLDIMNKNEVSLLYLGSKHYDNGNTSNEISFV